MIMIILLIPEDTPIIDTISAHKQEKTTDSSLVKRIYFQFLKNPAEIRNTERNTHKESLKERKSLKLNAKINEIYLTNENKRKKS